MVLLDSVTNLFREPSKPTVAPQVSTNSQTPPPEAFDTSQMAKAAEPCLAKDRCSKVCQHADWLKSDPKDLKACPFHQESECNWGRFRWPVSGKEPPLIGEDGQTLKLWHFTRHSVFTGGPGSGKTASIAHRFMDETQRCTHVRSETIRQQFRPGMVIMEGKGEFTEPAWVTSLRYRRAADFRSVGPQSLWWIDPFADKTMTPSMLAEQCKILMQTLGGKSRGGGEGADFFDKQAGILLTYLFTLDRELETLGWKGRPPMEFKVLSMLISDRGRALNQEELGRYASQEAVVVAELHPGAERLLHLLESVLEANGRLSTDLQPVITALEARATFIDEHSHDLPIQEWPEAWVQESDELDSWRENIGQHVLAVFKAWEPNGAPYQTVVTLRQGLRNMVVQGVPFPKDDKGYEKFSNLLGAARKELEIICKITEAVATLETQLNWGYFGTPAGSSPLDLAEVTVLGKWLDKCAELRKQALVWRHELSSFILLFERFSHLNATKPKPVYGDLREWIEAYKTLKKQAQGSWDGKSQMLSYFEGEYLNVVNDKTSGSVGMTARTMVELLSQPPFDTMFRPNANFDLKEIFSEGRIFTLDMNFYQYRDAARLSAVLYKTLIYRLAVSRDVMNLAPQRLVFNLIDEFATVATSGLWAGDPEIMAIGRGKNFGCFFLFQNHGQLSNVYTDPDIENLFANGTFSGYMRNQCPYLNKRGSESSGEVDRNNITFHKTFEEHLFNHGSDTIRHQPYQASYQKEFRLKPELFKSFLPGEGLFILPPEFGSKQIRFCRLENATIPINKYLKNYPAPRLPV